MRIPTLIVLCLALAVGPSLRGQSMGGVGGNSGPAPQPSPFFPDSGGGGGSGGEGYVPGDAGVPSAQPDPNTAPTLPEPTTRGVPSRNQGSRGNGMAVAAAAAESSSRNALALHAFRDSWLMWWETNKFDFIELRRLADAPLTGQGQTRESEAQRDRRLAEVEQVVQKAVLPALRDLTGSSDSSVRAAAIVALAKLNDVETVDRARELLSDGHREVRQAAMLSLGVLDAGRARYALMSIGADAGYGRKLMDRTSLSSEERGVALLSAALRGGGDAALLLDEILSPGSGATLQLLAASCEAAGLGGGVDAIPRLSEVALDGSRPEFIRSSALSALGRLGDPSVVPVLISALDQGGLEPRRAAVVALGLCAHGEHSFAVDRLVSVLRQDRDASTRHFAAISLGRLGGEQARAALLAAAKDASTDMRPWVALGLGLCERRQPLGDVVPLLRAKLDKESNPESAAAILVALGLCGGQDVVELLGKEARGNQPQRAGQACVALGLTRHPDALPVLREVLRSSGSPSVLQRAALGLGILGNSAAVPDLVDLMSRSNNAAVASWASLGVAFMGDQNAVGPLLHVIETQGPRGLATTYAVAALGQLFDGERRPTLSRLASGDNYLARSDAATSLLLMGF